MLHIALMREKAQQDRIARWLADHPEFAGDEAAYDALTELSELSQAV